MRARAIESLPRESDYARSVINSMNKLTLGAIYASSLCELTSIRTLQQPFSSTKNGLKARALISFLGAFAHYDELRGT